MPLLVIGNKNYSSWSLRPWLLLRHFGVAFDELRLNLDTPEFFEQIGRWSPTRSVPVLHDEGLVLPDSLAICEYANERWLEAAGQFQQVVRDFPKARQVPAAYLKMGHAYTQLEERGLAQQAYRALIEKHPDSEEAKQARAALNELGG